MSCEAEDAVADYLTKQNRPFSTVDIFNNLHKELGKTAVQKALDALVFAGHTREKLYGKQKVYVANQEAFDDVGLQRDIKAMDSKITELKEKEHKATKLLTDCEARLSRLVSTLPTAEAKGNLATTNGEIAKMEDKLRAIDEKKPLKQEVNPEEKEEVAKERAKYLKEWQKRKRIATEMIDSVLDSYPKGKKVLYEEVGIETDESLGVKMPPAMIA